MTSDTEDAVGVSLVGKLSAEEAYRLAAMTTAAALEDGYARALGPEAAAVIRAACTLVADWKAKRSTHGGPLCEAVEAFEAARPADDGIRYLLWDNERGMWWRPDGQGYTHDRSEAGRYTRDEAVRWALSGALHGDLEHANVIIAAH